MIGTWRFTSFAPPEVAERGRPGIKGLLERPDIRVLIYVWGGVHSRGETSRAPISGRVA